MFSTFPDFPRQLFPKKAGVGSKYKIMNNTQAFHIHAVQLPYGDKPQHWWIVDGKLCNTPIANAITLPGKFVIPGMVDAHTHLSMDFGLFGLPEASDAVVQANLQNKAHKGVLVVRDTGALPGAHIAENSSSMLHVLTSGNLNAPADRFHPGIYVPVEAENLVAYALRGLESGSSWVKIIADFPGPDFNFFDPIVNYPIEVVQDLCTAVHARGARVAAHVSGTIVGALVSAGIDSIEHGPMMTPEALADMAQRGTAWVPTLSTVTHAVQQMIDGGAPFARVAQRAMDMLHKTLPLAEKLGVPIMVGTDEHPEDYVGEVALLHAFGLSVTAALAAASTTARSYLGLPSMSEGTPADVVLFDQDPRMNLDALKHPAMVLMGGHIVESAATIVESR